MKEFFASIQEVTFDNDDSAFSINVIHAIKDCLKLLGLTPAPIKSAIFQPYDLSFVNARVYNSKFCVWLLGRHAHHPFCNVIPNQSLWAYFASSKPL